MIGAALESWRSLRDACLRLFIEGHLPEVQAYPLPADYSTVKQDKTKLTKAMHVVVGGEAGCVY